MKIDAILEQEIDRILRRDFQRMFAPQPSEVSSMRVGKEDVQRWILDLVNGQPGISRYQIDQTLWGEHSLELTSSDVELEDAVNELIQSGDIVEQQVPKPTGHPGFHEYLYWPRASDPVTNP